MFTQLQNSTLSIIKEESTQNPAGQITSTWVTFGYDNVKCRLSEAPKNITIEDRNYIVAKETFIFFVDSSYEGILTKDNRILFAGKEYHVLKVSNFDGVKSKHHIEAYCQIVNIGSQSGLQSGGALDPALFVPKTTKVNGKPLSGNIVIEEADIPNLVTDLANKQNIGTNYDDRTYTQVFSTDVVVVTHNFGKYPSVTVIDSAGDEVVGDIVHNSANQLTITFSASFVGTVYCN